MVLKRELRQRIGERNINRLRDLARQNRLNLHANQSDSFDDDELCSHALELKRALGETNSESSDNSSDSSNPEYADRLFLLIANKTPEERESLEQLLQMLTGDGFSEHALAPLKSKFISDLFEQYSPRALSVFFSTDFGKYVLDRIQQDERLTQEEEKKLLLGLTHITSRLQVRSPNLSDAPVIEYANLFMGKDIDLENQEHLLPLANRTLAQSITNSRRLLHKDLKVEKFLKRALITPEVIARLPLTNEEYSALPNTAPLSKLYRNMMNHRLLTNYLHNNEISQDNLVDAIALLGKSIPKLQQSISALETLEEESHHLAESDTDKLTRLSSVLKNSVKQAPTILERQALARLKDHVDFQVLEQTRIAFEEDLYQQLAFLERGGSEQRFTVSVNLGGALAVANVAGVSLGGNLEFTFAVTGNDDVRVREFRAVKPSLTITGGDKKLAAVTVEAGYAGAKGRVFRNLDEFVRFHSNDLIPTLLGSMSKLPGNIKGSLDVNRAQKLHRDITADRHLLSERLTQLGVLVPGDKIRVAQKEAVNFADFTKHSVDIRGTVDILAGLAEGSIAHKRSKTRFQTRTNLLPMLRNNPNHTTPPKVDYLSFWSPATITEKEEYKALRRNIEDLDTDAIDRLNQFKEENGIVSVRLHADEAEQRLAQLEKRLEVLAALYSTPGVSEQDALSYQQERLEIRDSLKKAMVDQYLERDMYYFTVNAMEGHIGEEAPQEHFHKAKHSMQEIYRASNRGDYIAAHIYTFYNLHTLYEKTFLLPESPTIQDSSFQQVLEHHIEPSLNRPQIHLDNTKHVRRSLTAESVASSTETNFESQLALSIPHTNLSVSADIKVTNIGKNVNPDNDGIYFNVGLNLNGGCTTAVAVKALETALSKMRLQDSSIPEIALTGFAPEVMGLSAEGGMRVEFNFVKRHKGWKLQYTRVSGHESIGINSPGVGIPTGPIGAIKVDGGIRKAGIHNWWERPGNNTLTYIYAKFNGWKAAEMIKTPTWEMNPEDLPTPELRSENPFYFYALQNQAAISELMINMGKASKSVHNEMTEMLDQILSNNPAYEADFTEDFKAQLKDYAESPTPEQFFPMLAMFERFLTLQHQVYLKEARSRYRPHYRKGRII
ncbi:hypothetical protein [Parendozoicomonas haliclonae]|uniref:hypothetical protein n=1 Tax=Parendozoicomonas haliclonae TaxID=1960125 RepID=UPI000B353759|nr:hypothetical protein [Parendozoicomonas haliclonae]